MANREWLPSSFDAPFHEATLTKIIAMGFPGGSDCKESACNAGDPGSIPGLGRSPREGNGYPLHYSCLGNPMDRGAWQVQCTGLQNVRHDLAAKKQQRFN